MKRIAFEPSNSWLKRCCDNGVLLVQTGWNTILRHGRNTDDDENPKIIRGSFKRQYGRKALERTGASGFDFNIKEEEARNYFEAVLLPEDDGKEIELVLSHWDFEKLETLQSRLEGTYSFFRNGKPINCTVKKTIGLLEGEGSYLLAKKNGRLNPGKTFVVEIGFGSVEFWVIDSSGTPEGEAITEFGVYRLADSIADDDNTRILFGVTAGEKPDIARISALLKGVTPEDAIDLNVWKSIRKRHVMDWVKAFNAYLTKRFASEVRNAGTIVLTGGGAEILRPVFEKSPKFYIPHNAQTASVTGAFHYVGRE